MNYRIEILLRDQILQLYDDCSIVRSYLISSGKKGIGEEMGSEKTPRGAHRIRAKIGNGQETNTVFVGRRPTGEIYTHEMKTAQPERDWILTRIMWLCGMEPGFNRFGNVDTMRRYIYIHGCPDEDLMGIPSSHGCIKMRNDEIIELFNQVSVGTPVLIKE